MNSLDAKKKDNILSLILFVNEYIVSKELNYSGYK